MTHLSHFEDYISQEETEFRKAFIRNFYRWMKQNHPDWSVYASDFLQQDLDDEKNKNIKGWDAFKNILVTAPKELMKGFSRFKKTDLLDERYDEYFFLASPYDKDMKAKMVGALAYLDVPVKLSTNTLKKEESQVSLKKAALNLIPKWTGLGHVDIAKSWKWNDIIKESFFDTDLYKQYDKISKSDLKIQSATKGPKYEDLFKLLTIVFKDNLRLIVAIASGLFQKSNLSPENHKEACHLLQRHYNQNKKFFLDNIADISLKPFFLSNIKEQTPDLYQIIKDMRPDEDRWKTDLSADMGDLGFD